MARWLRLLVTLVVFVATLELGTTSASAATSGPIVYGVYPWENRAGTDVFNEFSSSPERYTRMGLQAFNGAEGSNISELGSVVTIVGGAEAGKTVGGLNGLAIHPGTSVAYAVLGRVSTFNDNVRFLATIDLTNGEATSLGRIKTVGAGTDVQIAGITFAADGTLYAVSGDGSSVCRACLFELGISNGEATHLKDLGTSNTQTGCCGEAIAFNPDDGMIYHASGIRSSLIFEKLDPGNSFEPENIGLSSNEVDEITGIGYAGSGEFIVVDLDRKLWSVAADGTATEIGETNQWYRGVAVVPDPVDPVAVDDFVTVARDSSRTDIFVLDNDIDGTGTPVGTIDPLSLTQPLNGTAEIRNSGTTIGYTPDPGYCNTQNGVEADTFTYSLLTGSTAQIVPSVVCPVGAREVTLRYKKRKRTFVGQVTSNVPECVGPGIDVRIWKARNAGDTLVGTVQTNADGSFKLRKRARGKFYADVSGAVIADAANCFGDISDTIRVR